jgi:hypothetical protein
MNGIKNLRAFKIGYLGPTNYRGSRVKIEDIRRNKKIIISYNYEFDNTKDIAIDYLKKIGINIKYSFETVESYFLMTDDFESVLK